MIGKSVYVAGALLLSAIGAPGASSDEPGAAVSIVSQAFGNTIVSRYADGRQAQLWLNPDGSYEARGRRHEPSDGHWKVKGGKLCLRQAHPRTLPISYCTPIPSDPGTRQWSGRAFTGEPIEISLEPGRGT